MKRFLDSWLLPISMFCGAGFYLLYHFCLPGMHVAGPFLGAFASKGQIFFVSVMLFFQFVKVSPHEMQYTKWHSLLLAFQAILFVGLAIPAIMLHQEAAVILLESAMLCFICPTASAAGVITDKLGGNIRETVTYLVLINCLATILIPAVVPLVSPSSFPSFWSGVWIIARKLFPILILPALLAWLIRYTWHDLQVWLMRHAWWSFYIWGFSLMLGIVLATRALVLSKISVWLAVGIALVSLLCTFVQFFFGKWAGRVLAPRTKSVDSVTAGQALGQKNTGFLIWLGYSYLTPVTSVAGGLYAVWQNLFNSWELYEHGKKED